MEVLLCQVLACIHRSHFHHRVYRIAFASEHTIDVVRAYVPEACFETDQFPQPLQQELPGFFIRYKFHLSSATSLNFLNNLEAAAAAVFALYPPAIAARVPLKSSKYSRTKTATYAQDVCP